MAGSWTANYTGKLGYIVLERADLVVWLDPPLPTVLRRLGARTVRRVRSGEELWGGNRETWRGAFFSRDSLFLWALKTHAAAACSLRGAPGEVRRRQVALARARRTPGLPDPGG